MDKVVVTGEVKNDFVDALARQIAYFLLEKKTSTEEFAPFSVSEVRGVFGSESRGKSIVFRLQDIDALLNINPKAKTTGDETGRRIVGYEGVGAGVVGSKMAYIVRGNRRLLHVNRYVEIIFPGSSHPQFGVSNRSVCVSIQHPSNISLTKLQFAGEARDVKFPSSVRLFAERFGWNGNGRFAILFGPKFDIWERRTGVCLQEDKGGFVGKGQFVGGLFTDGVWNVPHPAESPRHSFRIAGDKFGFERDAIFPDDPNAAQIMPFQNPQPPIVRASRRRKPGGKKVSLFGCRENS